MLYIENIKIYLNINGWQNNMTIVYVCVLQFLWNTYYINGF